MSFCWENYTETNIFISLTTETTTESKCNLSGDILKVLQIFSSIFKYQTTTNNQHSFSKKKNIRTYFESIVRSQVIIIENMNKFAFSIR